MLEQPSLHITILDLDDTLPTSQALNGIAAVLRQSVESAVPDCEYALKNGTLHISRMLPEETMNGTFREKQDEIPRLLPLKDASPARLSIGTVGQFDTLAFRQEAADESPLAPGTVEIEVKSVGLNAKVPIALISIFDQKADRYLTLFRTSTPSPEKSTPKTPSASSNAAAS
jgi:hypothetical protein